MKSTSERQEERVANNLGGRRVIGSGRKPFDKGDVIVGDFLIECKTRDTPTKNLLIQKQTIKKAYEQSISMRKEFYSLALSFGDNEDYYLINKNLMKKLIETTL